MQTTLVGYTGFVGSNLAKKHTFDNLYNSKNIGTANEKTHDLVVYSGVRAEKFLANTDPVADKNIILQAIENIKQLNPKKLVLISTVDVYHTPKDADEDTLILTQNLHPYGYNRYLLEQWVTENIKDHLIVRLPGLFGAGIKKNFLYDMLTITPSMLTHDKYFSLCNVDIVKNSYEQLNERFYKLKPLQEPEKQQLKHFFDSNDFNALAFTDHRSYYQFYNLGNLWQDINTALDNGVKLLNLNSQPVCAAEIYSAIKNKPFTNQTTAEPVFYDLKTKHAKVFGGENGYINTKAQVLEDIKTHFDSFFETV